MTWHHLFIPHKQTHEKAQLISWHALAVYVLLFMFLQVGFSIIGYSKPGVLGISSKVDQKTIIELTNVERQKFGLSSVKENSILDAAAAQKAKNMFEENYWAHFAPSGKTPWDFITKAGYKFVFAGENLAKNFYTSDEVVKAWMASPSHKENIISSKYQEIGIAVAEGTLNGQKTTLVVQMFGSTQNPDDVPVVASHSQPLDLSRQLVQNQNNPLGLQHQIENAPLIDTFQVSKIFGLGLIGFVAVLMTLDFIVIRRRGVVRLASHNIAHLAILSTSTLAIFMNSSGSIL